LAKAKQNTGEKKKKNIMKSFTTKATSTGQWMAQARWAHSNKSSGWEPGTWDLVQTHQPDVPRERKGHFSFVTATADSPTQTDYSARGQNATGLVVFMQTMVMFR